MLSSGRVSFCASFPPFEFMTYSLTPHFHPYNLHISLTSPHRYVLLTTTSTLYAFFVEKDTVFVGRRKTLAKRIETEHVDISSRTLPHLTPGASPRYRVSVSYVRSSNGGKSLLGRGQASEERPYSDFFDEEGTMDQERFERWVGVMVERVMES